MRRWRSLLLLWIVPFATGACSPSEPYATQWVRNHGGIAVPDTNADERVAACIQPLLGTAPDRHMTVSVLASDAVTAYSLSTGQIFVTRGLIGCMSDAELQAAVAHEMGHLLEEYQPQAISGLRGCDRDLAAEIRADAAGVSVLRKCGLPPQGMISMLAKVARRGRVTSDCRSAIRQRIAVLSTKTDYSTRGESDVQN